MFKVHRSVLSNYSTIVRDMLSGSKEGPANSNIDDQLITLTGDHVAGWELLLGLQYNRYVVTNIIDPNYFSLMCLSPRITSDTLSGEDLLTMLTIAHKYQMKRVEEDIMEQLRRDTTYNGLVDLIVASNIVKSNEIYQETIQRLTALGGLLSMAQAKRIGVEATFTILTAEKAALQKSYSSVSYRRW
jgi:hypothetical protein